MDRKLYQQAESFLPWNLHHEVFNSTIIPFWSEEALYYFQQLTTEKTLIKVNTETGKKEPILCYKKLQLALSLQLKEETNYEQLSLSDFSIKEKSLYFTYKNHHWSYDFENNICKQDQEIIPGLLNSQDKNWALQRKDHNLILTDLTQKQDFQITTDGKPYYDYGSSPETNTYTVTQRIQGSISTPVAIWSPNSQKIITHKLDQREVHELFILQNAPKDSQRPKLHSYRMSFSGDDNLPLEELMIIDISTKSILPIKTDPLLSPYLTPIEFKWVWWSYDSKKIYFIRETRAAKEIMLCVTDAETGDTKVLLTEKSEDTYVEPSPHAMWLPQVVILEDSQEIIWLSERSGHAHLYLFNDEGNLKNAITEGEWSVREVHFYDDKAKWLYFTACGYDESIDPYYKYLFRCRLDGSDLQCLTKDNANHTIYISPQKTCFLDTYSTINSAPITVLKTMNGDVISLVESADISRLTQLNWVPPERFCVKARDGITNIYGNMYFPSHFDSSKRYPIIDHIYPGPQVYRTSTHFNLYGSIFRSAWMAQALAELGFIVIHVDGFGTPGRSKAFHDATYKNMSDCGIPDHVTAIKQLAEKNSFIDIEKVGITGYSGGGYAAVRAMLTYPDFYKVGVSAAGNHDIRCYPANYGEKYNSLDTSTYPHQSNATLAEKLEGKLLLVHGEMDDNVHPCATLQLVDALIANNKDFDMIIMPNQNHSSTFDHPYYIRRNWDYFVQYLLGETPPKNYLISPMPLDFPQIIDW